MTLQELDRKLSDLGISKERYYLHGLYGSVNDDNKLALVIKQGKYLIEYEVYYKERGEKHSSLVFSNEADACQYFYKRFEQNKNI